MYSISKLKHFVQLSGVISIKVLNVLYLAHTYRSKYMLKC